MRVSDSAERSFASLNIEQPDFGRNYTFATIKQRFKDILMSITLFYFIAFLSIFFALLVIFAKNPVHSVIYLIITFFTFSIHYILLNAQFLAIVNFIVYMGAIMVLFLFVLMLLNLDEGQGYTKSNILKMIGAIAGMCLVITLVGSIKALHVSDPVILKTQDLGLVKNLGKVLFSKFLLPFELSSLLLLSAMVGAVLLAKKDIKQA